ncbi:hypothetical protein NOGI109294_03190 [Nocardiopsis gilva]|uniref:hypothetical protein n=1 Tax=Nocardiopsis gilva TaxID=280236 RepID=UPI0018DF9A25|nr:hypothetical protein [Nocardiopsis gilva]
MTKLHLQLPRPVPLTQNLEIQPPGEPDIKTDSVTAPVAPSPVPDGPPDGYVEPPRDR